MHAKSASHYRHSNWQSFAIPGGQGLAVFAREDEDTPQHAQCLQWVGGRHRLGQRIMLFHAGHFVKDGGSAVSRDVRCWRRVYKTSVASVTAHWLTSRVMLWFCRFTLFCIHSTWSIARVRKHHTWVHTSKGSNPLTDLALKNIFRLQVVSLGHIIKRKHIWNTDADVKVKYEQHSHWSKYDEEVSTVICSASEISASPHSASFSQIDSSYVARGVGNGTNETLLFFVRLPTIP